MPSPKLLAGLLPLLVLGCGAVPSQSCGQDDDCGAGAVCSGGTCASEALHRSFSALVASPQSARSDVAAGVKPPPASFAVINPTRQGHAFAVSCDSGATPAPATGKLRALEQAKISVDVPAPPAGVSTVTCSVTSRSGATAYDQFRLTLNAGTPDFSIAAAPGPAALSIPAGGSGAARFTIAALNGFAGPLTLSASGLPDGTLSSFGPSSLAAGKGATTLTVQAGNAAPGTYAVLVTAGGGGLARSASLSVTIAR